jgi:hypothetical protein
MEAMVRDAEERTATLARKAKIEAGK